MARLTTIKPRVQMSGGRPMAQADANSWRSGKNANERGYTYQWQQARERYFAKHPLCVHCQANGKVVVATDLDHKVPHRGNESLFWDESNWQGLCKSCHSVKTQQETAQGL
ncbi:HNH endonuclease [Pseudomonas nicosulfuronedens]